MGEADLQRFVLPNEYTSAGFDFRPVELDREISAYPGQGTLVVEVQSHAANHNFDHGGIDWIADNQVGDLGCKRVERAA
jgi:hypothetical protein